MSAAEFGQTILDCLKEAQECLDQEDFDKALRQLGEAERLVHVRMANVHLAWGRQLEGRGESDKARIKYQDASRLDRGNPEFQKAIDALKFKNPSEEAHLQYRYGKGLERMGDIAGASECYRSAWMKTKAPEYAQAYTHTLFKQVARIIERYNAADSQQRKDPEMIRALKEAKRILIECSKVDPARNAQYQQTLADVSRLLNRKD